MDPLEWLARMSDHVPDPGQHRTLFFAEYSNRVRGSALQDDPEAQAGPAPDPRRRCSPTWARLITKFYQTDPLVCARCGQRMSLIAFVTDQMAIGKILDHLGLSTPEAAKPPPPASWYPAAHSRSRCSETSITIKPLTQRATRLKRLRRPAIRLIDKAGVRVSSRSKPPLRLELPQLAATDERRKPRWETTSGACRQHAGQVSLSGAVDLRHLGGDAFWSASRGGHAPRRLRWPPGKPYSTHVRRP